MLPTRVLDGRSSFAVGRLALELIPVDIHSADATVVWMPQQRILLAGDTLEDTLTFVAEPEHLSAHLADLDRLRALAPARILPNHGHPDMIARRGYTDRLIDATQQYVGLLLRARSEPALRTTALRELLAEPLTAGWITYFPPYEAVHRANLQLVAGED